MLSFPSRIGFRARDQTIPTLCRLSGHCWQQTLIGSCGVPDGHTCPPGPREKPVRTLPPTCLSIPAIFLTCLRAGSLIPKPAIGFCICSTHPLEEKHFRTNGL